MKKRVVLKTLMGKVNDLSPLSILARGYGILRDNDRIISSVSKVNKGSEVVVTLKDGELFCDVKEVKESKAYEGI